MAIPEDDGDIRRIGEIRGRSNAASMVGLVVAFAILGLIVMFLIMPRSGEPVRSIDGAARAPVTTTTPAPMPKQQ